MDFKPLAQRVLISQVLMLNLEVIPKYNEIGGWATLLQYV